MKKEPNQGEGDRASARRYDNHVHEFIEDGKVDEAAEKARRFVEERPREAARAEREAKRGPKMISVEEMVAKGRSLFERLRHAVRSRR